MSNRADRSSGHEIDPDSTDELPLLDPVAYQGAVAVESDKLSGTDSFAAQPATGAAELASVFDTIRSLEASLRAKSEHTADLEEQLARVERQLRVSEKDKAIQQSQIADLEDARDGLAADVEARGTTLARLKTDLAARADQIRLIEQQRDAVEIDKLALTEVVQARDARIASLEAEAAARAGEVSELEGLVLSHDEVDRLLKVSIGELEQQSQTRTAELAARDQQISRLNTQLDQKEEARGEIARALERQMRRLEDLDHDRGSAQRQAERCLEALQSLEARRRYHDEALFALEQDVDIHLQHGTHLEAELSQRAGEIAALKAGLRERDAVIDGLRGELLNRETAINEGTTELTRLRAITQDSGGVIADLEQQINSRATEIARLQGELQLRDTRIIALQDDLGTAGATLHDRDEELALVQATLESLRGQHAKRGQEVTDLIAALRTEQKRAAGLATELGARIRANAELESQRRVQGEVAESQARELDNWKEKWSEVAAMVGEKDARLAQAETDLRINAAELATRAERINTLQRSVEDQAESIAALEREMREKTEALGRLESDLRVAEDSMLRLESQLRQKTDQQSSVQRTLDEQRGQIRHLQDTLATRDATILRLEGELKASSEIIGGIQRDIRRLSSDASAPNPPQPQPEPPPAEPEPMTRLLVRFDEDSEVVHVISKKTTSIGRTDDNDIAIDTRYISRHHARILTVPNATVIEDLGSTNGVYVNDHRINRRQSLKDGDIVMVGKTRFRFAAKVPERSH